MKRWPVIRHIRFFYLRFRVRQWAWTCGCMGLGSGRPNPADLKQLERIWKGEA